MYYNKIHSATNLRLFNKGRISAALIIVVFLVGIIIPVVLAFMRPVIPGFIEFFPPEIQISETPRGIGLSPVILRVIFRDLESGLSSLGISVISDYGRTDLLTKNAKGVNSTEESVLLDSGKLGLKNGQVTIEITAKDSSVWGRQTVKTLQLQVDRNKPAIDKISSRYSARIGGTHFIIFQASDEALALTGVRVGHSTFPAFPAKNFDADFEVPDLYATFFTMPTTLGGTEEQAKLFAEDSVGNIVTIPLPIPNQYQNIQPRQEIRISSESQNGLLEHFGFVEQPQDPFKVLYSELRPKADIEIGEKLRTNARFEKFWEGAFQFPLADSNSYSGQYSYGDSVSVIVNDQQVANFTATGTLIGMSQATERISSSQEGIVAYAGSIPGYGRTVAIDHGLGIATVYGELGALMVKNGDQVKSGQGVGAPGLPRGANFKRVFIQTRIHGVPTNPQDLTDNSWRTDVFAGALREAKEKLRIPVRRGL